MLANNLTQMFMRFKRDLHLSVLYPRLPEQLKMEHWTDSLDDSLLTFSRYFPRKCRFVVDKCTCDYRREYGKDVFYIKDELLDSLVVLGVQDIDWTDTTTDNMGMTSQVFPGGIYVPRRGGIVGMEEMLVSQQLTSDLTSLFNDNIFLDFEEPNKIIPSRAGGGYIGQSSFVVNLLVKHPSIVTISPTKMETFEALAKADLANFLYGELKYFDNLDTSYLKIELILDHLQSVADSRKEIVDTLENSYVSTANDNIPIMLTING